MKRTLTLKKDTVAELLTDDLRDVAGGSGTRYTCIPCLVDRVTTLVPPVLSIDTPCS